jgi:hypothetical protein
MRALIPGDFLELADIDAVRAHIRAAAGMVPVPENALRRGPVVLRLRFLHELAVPEEGFAVRPPLPPANTLELARVWADSLEGYLWKSTKQQVIAAHVGREWANVTGVEVAT